MIQAFLDLFGMNCYSKPMNTRSESKLKEMYICIVP